MVLVEVQKKVNEKFVKKDIKEIYDYLVKDLKNPKSYYEHYNLDTLEYIKPFIDIDIEHYKKLDIDNEKLIDDTTNTLKEIFGEDSNVIYTTHHRSNIFKGTKTTKRNKYSYHFIIDNKKIKPELLKKVIRLNKDKLDNNIPEKYRKKNTIDTSVYGKGQRKFRLPLTMKETELETQNNKKKVFMKMSLDNNVENFAKYFVSITDDLKEIEIKEEDNKKEKKEEKEMTKDEIDDKLIEVLGTLNKDRLNKLLEQFTIFSHNKNKKSIYFDYYNLDFKHKCPFNKSHDGTNRRYLVLDYLDNSIKIKCFSECCKNKEKLILNNVFKELREFSLSIFMKLKSYYLQVKYIEKRVLYFSDLDKFKQIKYDRHDNLYLEDIKETPFLYSRTLKMNEEGEWDSKFFKEFYIGDENRQIFKNTKFYPSLEHSDKNYFNEFQGFGYMKILPFYVDKDKVYDDNKENLKFYLGFIKRYFCNNCEKSLNFLLCLLSFYLKYPHRLNAMILVLYSNQQGTGKSSFLEFIIKIIGKIYCSVCEMEQVTDKHSNLSYKKIINVIEELEYNKNKNYAKVLKNKSQAPTTTLNEKNEPMRTIDNFVHYIETTNDIRSCPLPVSDRRHFPLEVKKIYHNDKLINRVDELYNNDDFVYTFGRFLFNRNEPFNFNFVLNWEKQRPRTEVFEMMIKRDSIDNYMIKLLTLKNIDLLDNDDEDEYDDYGYNNNKQTSNNINDFIKDFKFHNHELIIKKPDLFKSYKNTTGHDRKFIQERFNTQIIEVRRYFKKITIEGNIYFQLLINNVSNQLKINEKYIQQIFKIIPIWNNDTLDYEYKNKMINEILNS